MKFNDDKETIIPDELLSGYWFKKNYGINNESLYIDVIKEGAGISTLMYSKRKSSRNDDYERIQEIVDKGV